MGNSRLLAGMMFVLFIPLVFSGCNGVGHSNLSKGEAGYITHISENSILVNDIVFSAKNDVEVVSAKGKKRSFADLEIGMKVEPWFDGTVRESFPAQADVNRIVVLSEKGQERIQKAVQSIVEYATAHFGNTVVFQETIVNDTYFQAKIAGVTIEHPNSVTVRYDFATKQVEEQVE
ncbi:DUF3221 domain-containing protein [Bacillus sp. DNRA2]|uniref:DUF3221 domain-containing protein n=1 Tax=Bacillus sp. DNRA2 TaxID=2723053 RepID=UPI00145DB082|nr:DUF3221 domain-containing protein [Bacillus sp. DNRA2]NMD70233.1 DUF3221 domain-containing protein [Bacillus sp. DNRA2]